MKHWRFSAIRSEAVSDTYLNRFNQKAQMSGTPEFSSGKRWVFSVSHCHAACGMSIYYFLHFFFFASYFQPISNLHGSQCRCVAAEVSPISVWTSVWMKRSCYHCFCSFGSTGCRNLMPVDYPLVHLHWCALFYWLTVFTLALGEFGWSGCIFVGLPVSFSTVEVYFKKPPEDSRFHCADFCCHSDPQFQLIFFQSSIYWFQFVRHNLLLGDGWLQYNQSFWDLKQIKKCLNNDLF